MLDKAALKEIGQVTGEHYGGYTVYVDPVESKSSVFYTGSAPDASELVRITYRIFRTPSAKRFVLRHFHNATEVDRVFAEKHPREVGLFFRANEHVARRSRRTDGTYTFTIAAGRKVDDPLQQLELEMMIDNVTEVTA